MKEYPSFRLFMVLFPCSVERSELRWQPKTQTKLCADVAAVAKVFCWSAPQSALFIYAHNVCARSVCKWDDRSHFCILVFRRWIIFLIRIFVKKLFRKTKLNFMHFHRGISRERRVFLAFFRRGGGVLRPNLSF